MNVSLDTNILIWAYRHSNDAATRDLQRRARILFQMLDESKAVVIVPTVVVAEYLAGVEQKHHGEVLALFRDNFVMPSFDLRAAALAAELWIAHRALPEGQRLSRQLLKADALVVSISRTAGAQRLYSNDEKCRVLARQAGIDARDLPTHHENMFVDQALSAEGREAPAEPQADEPPDRPRRRITRLSGAEGEGREGGGRQKKK